MKSMARNNFVYIRDLSFEPRRELCSILDADRRWEELGAIYMSYDMTTLTLLGQADLQKKSPTWEILCRYDEQNGTLKQLFRMLKKMDHQRAMAVLEPYVNEKYFLQATSQQQIGAKLRFASFEFETTPSCSSPSTSSQNHLSEAVSFFLKEKETLSTGSKFNHNSVNLNKEFTKASTHSKMNIPNTPQSHSEVVTMEKSLNHSNFKASYSGSEEESISDDCISEGMDDNMKNLKLQALANEDTQKQSSHLGACATSLKSQEDCIPDIMQISYEDVCKAADYFNEEQILGRGGFGTVYKGQWKGTFVAIKRFIPRLYSDDPAERLECMKQTLNELNKFNHYRFDHILPVYAVSLDGEYPCVIYQFMVNGSLEDRLLLKNETPPLTWSQRSNIAEGITKGLNYLHTTLEQPFVHGNIKSANIFLDANMDAKIGDLELTRGFGYESNALYLPSEYFQRRHLYCELDIYSYGIVLLEIATGLRPFDPKRSKGKSLSEYVQWCAENGRLESLRDPKAGEENLICFQELLYIGQICSSIEISKRPPMSQMLVRFEKLKMEMPMFDRIHRLVNDKSCAMPKNVSLLELQWYYNCLKPTRIGMSLANRLAAPLSASRYPGWRTGVHKP